MNKRRVLLLLLSATVIVCLVLLSASLSHVVFEDARPFLLSTPKNPIAPSTNTSSGGNINIFLRQAVGVIMAMLFVASLISVIIWPRSLKRILRDAITMAVMIWALYYILTRFRHLTLDEAKRGGAGGPEPTVSSSYNPLDFSAVNAPSWLVFLFVLGGIGILALIVWGLTRLWRSDGVEKTELKEIALLADETAKQIKAGMGIKNAVLRCYRDMCDLLSQCRGVPFEKAMTAREFEARLAAIGIKDEHIERLSRLFEWVRYGGKEASASEEHDAIECLQAIAKTYGSPA